MQSLSRQTSLVEDRIDDSEEDEFQEERSGMHNAIQAFLSPGSNLYTVSFVFLYTKLFDDQLY